MTSYIPSSTNVVNVKTNTTSGLTDHSAAFQGIVDALYGVILHAYQETRAELGVGCAGVEEGR